jgi:membrane protein DedA with SNARE-associated domain
MDSSSSSLLVFLSQYGLWLLYVWLLFGIFIVPVPEEAVMLTVGILISKGDFPFSAYLVAILGSLSGATFSYFLGRLLGRPFIIKFGKWVGITKKRLEIADHWFEKYGKWTLPIGYFTPGTRHLLSVVAGTVRYEIRHFMLFSYPAGVLWVCVMVTLGYVSGRFWLRFYHNAEAYIYYLILFIFVLFSIVLIILWYKHHHVKK